MNPVTPQATSPMFSPRDSQLIKHWLYGGAAIGGGTALATSLANYLGTLKGDADDQGTGGDDDTLYLNVRKKKPLPGGAKMASILRALNVCELDEKTRDQLDTLAPVDKEASVAGSLAIAGGVGTALGSYALIRNLYQKFKKKEVQQQLDGAQQGYLDVLDNEARVKQASTQLGLGEQPQEPTKGMGWTEALTSAPGAASILLAIASGAVTNKLLTKTFPSPKPPTRRDPRRVVIRSMDDQDKMATHTEVDDADATEFVYRLLLATKSASLQPFQNLLHGIGQGRRQEMTHGLFNYGIDTVENMVKGASAHDMEEPYLSMAVGLAARDEGFGPSLATLAAAEFNEHFPSFSKLAAAMPENVQEALCKVAALMGKAIRHDMTVDYAPAFDVEGASDGAVDKSAGALLGLLDDVLLAQTASNVTGIGKHKHPDGIAEENINSSQSEESTDGMEPSDGVPMRPKVQAHGEFAKHFENKHKDIIDAALATEEPPQ